MPPLPTEVLQAICEFAAKPVVGWPTPVDVVETPAELEYTSLREFSLTCHHYRNITLPYLFRRLRVRTVEEATYLVKNSLISYAQHLDLPAIDILTARRPIHPNLHALVCRIRSLRIGSTTTSFWFTGCTPLARLLCSAKSLSSLELCSDPILECVDAMPALAGLIPALPSSLLALRVTMPGGQPDLSGTETLLQALSDHPLPKLQALCLSMHMAPAITGKPERIAGALARRIQSLCTLTIVAPGRNPQKGSPLWDLVGPRVGTEEFGGFPRWVMGWEFVRSEEAEGARCFSRPISPTLEGRSKTRRSERLHE